MLHLLFVVFLKSVKTSFSLYTQGTDPITIVSSIKHSFLFHTFLFHFSQIKTCPKQTKTNDCYVYESYLCNISRCIIMMTYFKVILPAFSSRFIHSNRSNILNRSKLKFYYSLSGKEHLISDWYSRSTNMAQQNEPLTNLITIDGSYLEGVSFIFLIMYTKFLDSGKYGKV